MQKIIFSHEEISKNSRRIAASNLISRNQQIHALEEIIQNGWNGAIEASRRVDGKDEKHPNVRGDDDAKMKQYFSDHEFPQVQHPVNYDYRKLHDD